MAKSTMVVYTCDVCGRQFMRSVDDLDLMPPDWEDIASPYHSVYLMCSECSAAAKRLFDNMLTERHGTGLPHSKNEEVRE